MKKCKKCLNEFESINKWKRLCDKCKEIQKINYNLKQLERQKRYWDRIIKELMLDVIIRNNGVKDMITYYMYMIHH